MGLSDLVIPPWFRWAAMGLGAALCFGAGFKVESWRWSSADLYRLQAEQKQHDKQADKIHTEGQNYEQGRQSAREANDTRQQQVRIIYRDKVVPAECEPGPDAKRLLDDALKDAGTPARSQSGSAVPPTS